jgi:hypothetical protein
VNTKEIIDALLDRSLSSKFPDRLCEVAAGEIARLRDIVVHQEALDIVSRLRSSATQCRAIDRSQLLLEAASEIEKMRKTIVRMTLEDQR